MVYCAPVWNPYAHYVNTQFHKTMRMISGSLKYTHLQWLPILSGITPHDISKTNVLSGKIFDLEMELLQEPMGVRHRTIHS